MLFQPTQMERADVVIVGGGPAGASCAIVCAQQGLRTVLLERATFPREKVCGDCLNPACWPVLDRLGVTEAVRQLPHGPLDMVEFIGISGASVRVNLPPGQEIAVKRSLFDHTLLTHARSCGADIRENALVTRVDRTHWGEWRVDFVRDNVVAPVVVAADGRNSNVARGRGLLPKIQRERIALQSHIPLPNGYGNRVVLQFLRQGYSGQAPVNDNELNLCLVGRAKDAEVLKSWASQQFRIPSNQSWRTITPLTRAPLAAANENLFLIGDAARVVEPFTGEGIYYAMRSGELAANTIIALARDEKRELALEQFTRDHARMYAGRLWINQLARAAVVSPRIGSAFLPVARAFPGVLRGLTRKITG